MKVIQVELVDSQAGNATRTRLQGIDGVAQVAIVGTVTTTAGAGITYKDSVRRAYTTAITSSAWTTLIASTAAAATKILIHDGGGQVMELGIGASPARTLLVPPGGFNFPVDLVIPAGSKISYRAVGAASVGDADNTSELVINLLG